MSDNVINIQSNIRSIPEKVDYLLVCASFEDRCLSIIDQVRNVEVKKTGVFYCKQFQQSSFSNIAKLTHQLKFAKGLEFDGDSPTTIADCLLDLFSDADSLYVNKPCTVLVDISTFTREALLIVVRFLQLNKNIFDNVYVYYRTAEVSNNLSQGVSSIRSVIGYMGDVQLGVPTHLVILSGFEFDRAKEIIDSVEPDYISIGYGTREGSINDSLYQRNKMFANELAAYYSGNNVSVFCHSLVDISEAKSSLVDVIASKDGHNVVLAPLNTKLSTVAAGLAAIENPVCQIIYAQMESYNTEYYSETKPSFVVNKIDF